MGCVDVDCQQVDGVWGVLVWLGPASLANNQFHLEPLGPQHNQADQSVWMSSIEHIRSTPGYPDGRAAMRARTPPSTISSGPCVERLSSSPEDRKSAPWGVSATSWSARA